MGYCQANCAILSGLSTGRERLSTELKRSLRIAGLPATLLRVTTFERPRELAWQIFRGSAARKEGLLSTKHLRNGQWLRLGYDLYADSRLERNHELRCHAVLRVIPQHTYLAGPSAAFLYGVEHAATFQDAVHLVIPAGTRLSPRRPAIVHRMILSADEHTTHRGFPLTTPLRTCWDLALWLEPIKAVAIIDGLLRIRLVTGNDLDHLVGERLGRHGTSRVAKAFGLADGGAESPAESALRVRLLLRGFPRPSTQFPIHVNGGVLHPDLAWPEYLVAVEYDGLWHNEAEQFHRDRQRLNQLEAAGWAVVHVTGRRMRSDFGRVVDELKRVLKRRGWPGHLHPER
jgi:very-short-patch-repair endonuclease